MCSAFMRLEGNQRLQMNTPDLLSTASLENNLVKKLSCARFVNEVKTTGAQTHCWHLVCDAALIFSGQGEWKEAAEAVTHPHSRKGASED